MSATPRPPIANMQNLMIRLGAAVPNTVISGSAMAPDGPAHIAPKVIAKKTVRRR